MSAGLGDQQFAQIDALLTRERFLQRGGKHRPASFGVASAQQQLAMLPRLERKEQRAAIADHVLVVAFEHDGLRFIRTAERGDAAAAQHLSHAAIEGKTVSDRKCLKFARKLAQALHVVEETREPGRALQVDRVRERMDAGVRRAFDQHGHCAARPIEAAPCETRTPFERQGEPGQIDALRTRAGVVPADAGQVVAHEAGERFLAVAEPEEDVGHRDVRLVLRAAVVAVLRALQHVLRRGARLLQLKRGELRGPDAELDHRDFARIADSFAHSQRGCVAGAGFGMQPAVHAAKTHAQQTIGIELETARILLFAVHLQGVQAVPQQRDGFREVRILNQLVRDRCAPFRDAARVP